MGGRDEVFSREQDRGSRFVFDEGVAKVFDDMLDRSVPFYAEQQRMIGEIARYHCPARANIFDVGCSTATTLINLHKVLGARGRFVGYDNSKPMLERAQTKIANAGLQERVELRLVDLDDETTEIDLEGAGIVIVCWTLQFVRPLRRDRLIRLIHDSLLDGGVLVMTEKVLARSAPMNQMFIDHYYEMKRRNGYSDTEISRKREALENVLVPYTIQENLDLLARNGFGACETFFQWHNFAGFVGIKGI